MSNTQEKIEAQVDLFNFTYAIVAAGIGFAVVNKLAGTTDPLVSAGVLVCLAVVVPLTAWISAGRLRRSGALKLEARPVSGGGQSLPDMLDAFLDSPALDGDQRIFSFTRAHHLRGIPMSLGIFLLLPGILFLLSSVPGIPAEVWIAVVAAGVLLSAAGYFWRFRYSLNLKERTLVTSFLGKRTETVAAIGAQASWILATKGNTLVLQERHALYAFNGKEMIRISNFERPARPVFAAGEAMARAAGVPVLSDSVAPVDGRLVPADTAIHLDWWVISLPMAFILTMGAMAVLRGLH
jgi:hypothetical protein